jgi:hypothetical protein
MFSPPELRPPPGIIDPVDFEVVYVGCPFVAMIGIGGKWHAAGGLQESRWLERQERSFSIRFSEQYPPVEGILSQPLPRHNL